MHLGLLVQLPECGECFAVGSVLAAQLLDALLHRRVKVVPPRFIGQREVIEK